jgi:hypothetical protein
MLPVTVDAHFELFAAYVGFELFLTRRAIKTFALLIAKIALGVIRMPFGCCERMTLGAHPTTRTLPAVLRYCCYLWLQAERMVALVARVAYQHFAVVARLPTQVDLRFQNNTQGF